MTVKECIAKSEDNKIVEVCNNGITVNVYHECIMLYQHESYDYTQYLRAMLS